MINLYTSLILENNNENNKIVGMFLLAIIIMGISQTIALLFDIIIPFYGIGTILSSITYILLTFSS